MFLAGHGVGGGGGQHGEHRGGVLQSLLGAGRPPGAPQAAFLGQRHGQQHCGCGVGRHRRPGGGR
jgi:hypothetical protein